MLALASEPTIKGSSLLDGPTKVLTWKTQSVPGGTTITTVTARSGAVAVVLSLAPVPPSTVMLGADFQELGLQAPNAASATSVQLKVTCPQKVRLFFGASPTSGGTWGWEDTNTVRSATVKAGSVICVADSRDTISSCWTASGAVASIEVDCGGIRAR